MSKICQLYPYNDMRISYPIHIPQHIHATLPIYIHSSPCIYFFYLGFLSRTFTTHKTAGEGGYLLTLPLPPTSQILRKQVGDYCREWTSVHNQHADLNKKSLFSRCKLLTNMLPIHPYLPTLSTSIHNPHSPSISDFFHFFPATKYQ